MNGRLYWMQIGCRDKLSRQVDLRMLLCLTFVWAFRILPKPALYGRGFPSSLSRCHREERLVENLFLVLEQGLHWEIYFLQKCFRTAIEYVAIQRIWAHHFLGSKGPTLGKRPERTLVPSLNKDRLEHLPQCNPARQNKIITTMRQVYRKESSYQTILEFERTKVAVCVETTFWPVHKKNNMTAKQYLPLGHAYLRDFCNCEFGWCGLVKDIHARRRLTCRGDHWQGFWKYTLWSRSSVVVIKDPIDQHTWPGVVMPTFLDLFTCGTNVHLWFTFWLFAGTWLGCTKLNLMIWCGVALWAGLACCGIRIMEWPSCGGKAASVRCLFKVGQNHDRTAHVVKYLWVPSRWKRLIISCGVRCSISIWLPYEYNQMNSVEQYIIFHIPFSNFSVNSDMNLPNSIDWCFLTTLNQVWELLIWDLLYQSQRKPHYEMPFWNILPFNYRHRSHIAHAASVQFSIYQYVLRSHRTGVFTYSPSQCRRCHFGKKPLYQVNETECIFRHKRRRNTQWLSNKFNKNSTSKSPLRNDNISGNSQL